MTDLRPLLRPVLPLFSLLAGLSLSGAAPAAPSADVSRTQAQSVADAGVDTLRRRSEAAGERFRQLPPPPPPTPSRLLPPLPPPAPPAPLEAIRRSPPPPSPPPPGSRP